MGQGVDWLDSQEFYELMQQYRHARDYGPGGSPAYVVERFEAVKAYIRDQIDEVVDEAVCNAWRWTS